jgi:1,4-alpha-glucan branching enzyme
MPQAQIFFKLHAPSAKTVYTVGNFNNWVKDDSSLMKKLDNGNWIKIISLQEGTYYYKFVVDGRWIEDPTNTTAEPDSFGGKNSIISVKTS